MLLHTFPLHDLRRGDGLRDADLRHYDSSALAMSLIALIVDHMGVDREVDRGMVETSLRPVLEAMDGAAGITPETERHARIVDKVLGGLRNDAERRRPFSIEYADLDEEGRAIQRKLEFRLVHDAFHPDGGTVLRLSKEAVNLFLNALELDIEDAQAAMEAIIESQLHRGRFEDAVESARTARLQSLRYHERIHRILRDTRRDVMSVDWKEEVPRLLEEALLHIRGRLAVEASILAVARERLNELPEGDPRSAQVAEVARLVHECIVRHTELQDPLMCARNVFLDEQARQGFLPPAMRARPDLEAQVVEPLLRMAKKTALGVAEEAAMPLLGAHPPALMSLADIVRWQLRPRRELKESDVDVVALDLVTRGQDPPRFSDEVRARAWSLVLADDRPRALSEILSSVSASDAQEVAEAIALISAHAFAPDAQSTMPIVVERRSDAKFHVAGVFGDDVIVRKKVEGDES